MCAALAEALALLKCHRFPDEAARRSIANIEALLAGRQLIAHPSHHLGVAVCCNCYLDDGDEAIKEPCHPSEDG